jgi:DNA-binding response OmpR family regulator
LSHVLIVEDDRDIADLIHHYLVKVGHTAETVVSGSEVLDRVSQRRPDVVILDLMLPGMHGFDICRAIRNNPPTADLPIIIVTARAEESERVVGLELGADDYVTKPFSVMELLARLGALLRRSAWAAAGREALTHVAPAPLDDGALRDRFGLTSREIAVTRLLVEGLSNAEIAQRLEVSYYTARNHTEKVLLKLGVPSRAAVGAIVYGKR